MRWSTRTRTAAAERTDGKAIGGAAETVAAPIAVQIGAATIAAKATVAAES